MKEGELLDGKARERERRTEGERVDREREAITDIDP